MVYRRYGFAWTHARWTYLYVIGTSHRFRLNISRNGSKLYKMLYTQRIFI